jgi:ribosome-interacting GTPase 1
MLLFSLFSIFISSWLKLLSSQLNLDRLLARMWDEMGLVRVYTKPQGQQPDFSDPVVLSTVCFLPFMLFMSLCTVYEE